jgi:hypothetical protein
MLKEPAAKYPGAIAFVLAGLPPFLKRLEIPNVGLYLQNPNVNPFGVLDDLNFVAELSPLVQAGATGNYIGMRLTTSYNRYN